MCSVVVSSTGEWSGVADHQWVSLLHSLMVCACTSVVCVLWALIESSCVISYSVLVNWLVSPLQWHCNCVCSPWPSFSSTVTTPTTRRPHPSSHSPYPEFSDTSESEFPLVYDDTMHTHCSGNIPVTSCGVEAPPSDWLVEFPIHLWCSGLSCHFILLYAHVVMMGWAQIILEHDSPWHVTSELCSLVCHVLFTS